MKRKRLLLLLCITILTSSGCGEEKTPVISNNVETEVLEDDTTEPESNADSKEAVITEEVIENNQETTEINPTSNVDSTGSDVTIDEGDYIEPSVEEMNSEVTENLDEQKKQAIEDLKSFYEAGIITEEEYKEGVETLTNGPSIMDEVNNIVPAPGSEAEAIAKKYEEATIKARESSTNGKGKQVINDGNYDIELPDEYKWR